MTQWHRLNQRLASTLVQFHQTLNKVPRWQFKIKPSEGLSEVCASYKKLGITIPENFNQITAELSHNLESLGEIPVFWQHGDFCVNNMLIDKNVIGIVDFEHFGRVRMPFHDEFRAVDSLHRFAPRKAPRLWWDTLLGLVDRSVYRERIENNHLPGLYLHSLLWWMIESHGRPSRGGRAQELSAQIERFFSLADTRAGAPTDWIGPECE